MQFKEYITPEMQNNWFESINNPYNYYFLITSENIKLGLISCKNTSMDTRIAEGGIFIWDEKFWGTPIPVLASMSMLETIFFILESGEASTATIRKENKRALKFNELLGYKIIGESENKECWRLILYKSDYIRVKRKLEKSVRIFSQGQNKIFISGKPDKNQDEVLNDYFVKQQLTAGGQL